MGKRYRHKALIVLSRLLGSDAGTVRIVNIGNRTVIGLPQDTEAALKALAMYQPQKPLAKIATMALRFMIKSHLIKFFGGKLDVQGGEKANWLAEPSTLGFLLGNPNHKVSRAILSYRGADGWEVAKLVVGEKNEHILMAEANVLDGVRSRGVRVPEHKGLDRVSGASVLRMGYVEASGNQLTQTDVVDYLTSMLSIDKFVISEWEGWEKVTHLLIDTPTYHTLSQLVVTSAIKHGDFAPWNIRKSDQGLVGIDWEYGDMNAPSGIDLVHYLSQEYELVYNSSSSECVSKVYENLILEPASEYLKQAGWSGHELCLMALSYACVTARGQQDQSRLLEAVLNFKIN